MGNPDSKLHGDVGSRSELIYCSAVSAIAGVVLRD
jgi:hypothetical protein